MVPKLCEAGDICGPKVALPTCQVFFTTHERRVTPRTAENNVRVP
jgi:hypothetical protein